LKSQIATEQLQRNTYDALYPNSTLSYDEAKKSLEIPQSVLEWRKWRDQQYLSTHGIFTVSVQASAASYKSAPKTTTFEVVAKKGDRISNKI
jgi:hypothetical protein